ncbi:MAG: thiol:disulfide interchange protein DsbA/DsbL [Burkholderiales bacterium]
MRTTILVLVLCAATNLVRAADPMEDVDYVRISAGSRASTAKIEVTEFFYYGCGACNRFDPHIQAWLASIPTDVSYLRIPALRRTEWVPLARLFFALQELGDLERSHSEVYREIHDHGRNLGDFSQLSAWADQHGIDRNRLKDTLESDRVAAMVQQARDATIAYGIKATPSLVVDGRYLTNATMAGSVVAMIGILDALIDKARADRSKP